jgi:drug/metabolite transporter (DMT)-like permease
VDLHRTTGRTALGLTLALLTALVWGTMPVALKVLVGWLDAYTLSWSRFLAAGILIAPVVLRRHGASALRAVAARPLLMLVCVAGLTGNYVFYQSGLRFVSPDTAQIIVQLSPVFVLIGGVVIYREPFSRLQALGFAALIAGMPLFFNLRWADLAAHASAYSFGVLLVTASAVLWSGYMLAQKQLLTVMAPETILLVTYIAGAAFLLPAARPPLVLALPPHGLVLLIVVVFMTLASYLAFGAAMNHLEASRIGAVIAVSPLLTVAAARLMSSALPGVVAFERLNALSVIGAVLVVAGSVATTLARRR